MRNANPCLTVVMALLATVATRGHTVELASVSSVELEEIDSRLFSLAEEQEVMIRAVAFRSDRAGGDTAAWILDRSSREPVWQLAEAETVRRRSRIEYLEDSIELPAGDYELYYAAYPSFEPDRDDWIDWLVNLVRGFDRDELEETAQRLEIIVTAEDGRAGGRNSPGKVRDLLADGAILALTGVGDDEYLQQAFGLSAETSLEVYALAEASRSGVFDGAWIIDLDSGERVWELDYRRSEAAGGADKNRLVRTTLQLPAGRYSACYFTDSSHSWPEFNALPPYDPMAWGLTIRPASAAMAAHVAPLEVEDPLERNVIVRLTGLRNDDHRSAGFTLLRPQRVRVFAVGEGRRYEMHDYGWIITAHTRERVWEMEYDNTRHAGGAEKNRVADEVLELAAGSYLVHFVTDDSHSFRDWNASPPYQQDRWGITLVGVGDDFDAAQITPYEPAEDPALLARIEAVRNREHMTARFKLPHPQEVLIYAIGEGVRGDMVDYGWIEDANGRAVWEMTYRMTEHAGGARKNRLVRTTILLEAGEYEVHYETDGSHAFRRWNAAPPHDPESWGITVLLTGP